jgi:two-component system, OmpR family, sensor histidine kinase KdpD
MPSRVARDSEPKSTGRIAAAAEVVAVLALITFLGRIARLNLPTVGFLFLVAVLFVASRRPLSFATVAAIGATLCYNFFFFPPRHTLRIADPENWVALGAFLATSLLANRMLVRQRLFAALRESNDLKTSLLQAISHDLHSPLTVLSVEIQALARKGGSHPDAGEHIAVVREEVARLHRRIENLLSLARFEQGIAHPKAEPTPAADLFRSARESLAVIVQSRPIRAEVAPDVPELLVDPSLALEIIVNLVENAHRVSPPGEPIDLRAERSPDAPGRVRVEVLDHGPGFSPSEEKTIERVGFPDAESRGLGIPLAKTLAALSGGNIEWLPRPMGGTIARLELPAAPIASEEASS